jgi:hypothetical protein
VDITLVTLKEASQYGAHWTVIIDTYEAAAVHLRVAGIENAAICSGCNRAQWSDLRDQGFDM